MHVLSREGSATAAEHAASFPPFEAQGMSRSVWARKAQSTMSVEKRSF